MTEIWKYIPGYENTYQVSNLGRVKSLLFNKEMDLKQAKTGNGYFFINIYKNGKPKAFMIHQLVAICFLNYTRNGFKGLIIDHINNIKTDNHLNNLQIISQRENCSKDKKDVGAIWHKRDNVWQSQIRIDGKNVYLGSYIYKVDALKAYQDKLKSL